jgi:uncharacterized protein
MTDQRKFNLMLDRMVKRLVSRFNPDQIILFGSHAHGDAHPESDIDLLVVLPFEGSRRAKQVEMRVALHDIRAAKDIIVVTPEEVMRQRRIPGTIVKPALQDGKLIYARQS